MGASDQQGEPGVVRVLVSSTFLDMHAERDCTVRDCMVRDCMVNVVFPNLRRRFRPSGVQIVDVDLRWGITEVQSKRGETIGLCLGEIDRRRPFSWDWLATDTAGFPH